MKQDWFFNNRKLIYTLLFFISLLAAFSAEYAMIFRIKAMVISFLSLILVFSAFSLSGYSVLQNSVKQSEKFHAIKKWKTNFRWQEEQLLVLGLSLYTLNFYFILSVFIFFYFILKKKNHYNQDLEIPKHTNEFKPKLKNFIICESKKLLITAIVYMALDVTREFSVWHTVIFRPIVIISFGIILFIYCISSRMKT